MKATFLASAAAWIGLALANPTPTVDKRATTLCGQWDSLATGGYTVYNNLWGESAATSGSQCTTVQGMSGTNLVWSTSWSWQGGSYNVKSYANAVASVTPKQISTITSIPTKWSWSYTGSGIVANVAYDAFTSSTSAGSAEYEIMIWLAALGGAGPISATGSAIASPTINGVTWQLWNGLNGQMNVFSFVATSQQTSFSADLMDFIDYLTSQQGMPTSQYLQSFGAGTEPFVGTSAVLTTTAYSLSVK